MRHFFTLCLIVFFSTITTSVTAQEIVIEGKNYKVEQTLFFQDDIDVTETLTVEEKAKIMAAIEAKKEEIAHDEKAKQQKEQVDKATEEFKAAEEENKRAEKEKKRAEKEMKKAEKQHKRTMKAKTNHNKAVKAHDNAVAKYEKLKGKGKLSPLDEEKWLKKIEKLKAKQAKAKAKL